jgi:ATP-binding cassette subfamily B protein
LRALGEYKKENVTVANSLVVLNIAQAFIIACGLSGSLFLAYYQITGGMLQIGDFVMINTYILQMYAPLGFLGTFWRFIRQSMVDVEMVFELLEVDEKIKEVDDPINANIHRGEIEFRNVSFTYDKKLPEEEQKMIIKDLSFKVPAGKSVAIVGSTGSGKSTIMRLLYRFYDIAEGQILIDGQDISQMRLTELRKHIAIVPQDCVLFNDTIMYNIGYGGIKDPSIQQLLDDPEKEQELIDKIIPAAQRSQIHDFIMTKSKGYKERVGERGLKLSGGEKQRVAIARALLKATPIMCFDEATSALDTETEREI